MYFLTVVIFLGIATSYGKNIDFHQCDIPGQTIQVSAVALDSYPIEIGKQVNVSLNATTSQAVEDKTLIKAFITYSILTLSCPDIETLCIDICKEVKENPNSCKINGKICGQCPIPSGKAQVTNIPIETPYIPFIPEGTEVNVTANIVDPNEKVLGCFWALVPVTY